MADLTGSKTPGLAPAPKTEFQNAAQARTLLTENTGSDSRPIYTGDQTRWTRVTFRLISAGGVVAVGFSQNVSPPLSGRGEQLLYGEALTLTVPPAMRVYYAADSRQRISFSVEPFPWLEQILITSKGILDALSSVLRRPTAAAAAGAPVATGTPRTIQSIGSPPTQTRVIPGAHGRSPLPPVAPPGVVRFVKK